MPTSLSDCNFQICVARNNSLSTTDRSPGESGFIQLAGPPRNPVVTSHYEYGVKCVIDLNHCFFSPRMAPERLRLSQLVARGNRVLVVFAGVGMEALLIAARTEASEVVAIEKNAVAAECLRRAKRMLERNKTAICPGAGAGAAARLNVIEGDAMDILPTSEHDYYDRIIAPRPKEGALDGDLGNGDAGLPFLLAMLPLLKSKGEMHWYDFAADHELPECDRTRKTIESACQSCGLEMEVLHVAKAGSVAKRQWRVCVDFKIIRP
jgi:tRNA (guanine37-N1)-methyltransferase